ncbi:hypothetical protein QYE76_058895 [Lolium multiflorum]|uniref:F-box domain-containing protein n=1 Tax=Lolium multiflorum TaxID=4521 RepID=A0AAD8WQE8_LOLMU|nr:hypothetical protein QYE76_058895 [Lolium multiflorum]
MAEAAGAAEAAPLHGGLPDEIVVWEILVRLPPKSLLRCRAVCPAWRRATSTRDFLLAHHARQPSLPLLCGYVGGTGISLDVIPFDHRAGVGAVDQLQPVARLGKSFFGLRASCDGLLLLSGLYRNLGFSICNPATRQYARLPQLDGFAVLGIYPHSPTGEYRLLLAKSDVSYVFTLGSDQPPRHIWCPVGENMVCESSSVLFHGSLHWHVQQEQSGSNMVKVFNTTTESFRRMHAPSVPGKANLFEMDGMLGMSSFNDAATTIDIWTTQDYKSEAWAIKYRVALPVAQLTVKFGKFGGKWRVIPSCDGDVLVLAKFGDWLLQIDMDGKLVSCIYRPLQSTNQLRLKQSLVQHAFFPTLEGYVVNDSPFI